MSTLFNLNVAKKEKLEIKHPWENRIKDGLSHKMKYAHNSVRNPEYPKKDKTTDAKTVKVKFTIIGNRVTKEFNYCVKLVKDLHKYRPNAFEDPVIRGVTGVEWPMIWHDLKLKYGGLAFCLLTQVAVLYDDKIIGGEQELKKIIEEKYNYYFVLDYYTQGLRQFCTFVKNSGRPCVYMHISIDNKEEGTLIFMLYSDIVPYTCENFLRLCQKKKGGYSGTPVHRIVKDGWIQCGGFGLKSVDLDCENFIIPHDRRGVLCMANDGKHIDCSTQFFVLLQPADWMDKKYVAFGQLIDGESTLKKIENVPTFYEDPKLPVIIDQSGILNLDCQDIMINRGTVEYIHGHIENLYTLGEDLMEELLYKVFAEIVRRQKRIDEPEIQGEENIAIHTTERFMKKKEDFESQSQRHSSIKSKSVRYSSPGGSVNNDFDVDVYDYEPEEYIYPQVSLSPVIKPDIPYYIALTDVPYPGEKDSTYDFKKLLYGNYCLEADLRKHPREKVEKEPSLPSFILHPSDDNDIETDSENSLDSADEKAIKLYLKNNTDRVSFAGEVIRNIARGKASHNIFEEHRRSTILTDNQLRTIRMATNDLKYMEQSHKKVSISVPFTSHDPRKIKRRQTGFVDPEDLRRIESVRKSLNEDFDDEIDDLPRKVRIDPSLNESETENIGIKLKEGKDKYQQPRPSLLARLYDNLALEDEIGPTLKNYKPLLEFHPKNMMLTVTSNSKMKTLLNEKEPFVRVSTVQDDSVSYERLLNLQHGKRLARKISSDYVKTIGETEQNKKISLRSVEFAKIRPSMTVSEYQQKNRNLRLGVQTTANVETAFKPEEAKPKVDGLSGLRLPGDTPLYSSDSDGLIH